MRGGVTPARLLAMGLGLCSGPAVADLRANYELKLAAGQSAHGARTSVAVTSGVAIVNEFSPVDVWLVPRVDEAGGYDLDVQLAAKARSDNAVSAPTTRSFRGQIGTPLEFEANFDGWVVSGAIMLHDTSD